MKCFVTRVTNLTNKLICTFTPARITFFAAKKTEHSKLDQMNGNHFVSRNIHFFADVQFQVKIFELTDFNTESSYSAE